MVVQKRKTIAQVVVLSHIIKKNMRNKLVENIYNVALAKEERYAKLRLNEE